MAPGTRRAAGVVVLLVAILGVLLLVLLLRGIDRPASTSTEPRPVAGEDVSRIGESLDATGLGPDTSPANGDAASGETASPAVGSDPNARRPVGDGRIRGRILGGLPTGEERVDFVALQVRHADDGSLETHLDFAWEGCIDVTGIPPGRYRVLATARDGRLGEVAVEVKTGETVEADITLAHAGEEIAGRVLSAGSGEPVAGALVGAIECDSRASFLWSFQSEDEAWINGMLPARTDESGRYRIRGLRPGRWNVVARAPGMDTALVENVAVPGAGPELRLRPAGDLEVLVLDAGGDPVAEAWVWLELDAVGSSGIDAETDASGRARLTSVPAGRYEIGTYTRTGRWGVMTTVIVEKGETRVLTLRPPASDAWLICRGESRTGYPAEHVVRVEQTGPDGEVLEARSRKLAEDGFRVDGLRSGPATVTFRGLRSRLRRRIELRPGENSLEMRPPASAVLLQVVDAATGRPLRARAEALLRHGAADEDGRLRLDLLPEAEVEVTVRADGYAPVSLTTTPSETPEERRVALRPAHRVELNLLDGDGAPVPGARLSVVDGAGREHWPLVEDHDASRALLGRRVLRLAAGTYELQVTAHGSRAISMQLVVPVAGATTIRLEPE